MRGISSILALVRDLRGGCTLVPIQEEQCDGILYRGLRRNEIVVIERLYALLSSTSKFPWHRRIAFWLLGRRMVVVALTSRGSYREIVGFDMFYFNQNDIEEQTVHEGFIGVMPEWQGKKIGSNLRQHAIRSFRQAAVKGISTRIDMDNEASLASAFRTGFEVVATYRDAIQAKERAYLVCRFSDDQEKGV